MTVLYYVRLLISLTTFMSATSGFRKRQKCKIGKHIRGRRKKGIDL